MCNFSIPLLDCVVYQSCVFHNLFIKIGEKTIKNDQKRSKNDLTSHTQLHRHVRLFYPLTYIFGTLRDWTHKHNAAIFDSLSIWTKKDTRQEEKNVVGFLFFHFENRQTKSDLLGTSPQTFQWTIVFRIFWDCIFDDNFTTFESMIRRNQKVRGSNVKVVPEEVFFFKKWSIEKKNLWKVNFLARWTVVWHL